MYLAVSLRGQAQGVFGNIANKSHDYLQLVASLEERFAPPNQTELYCGFGNFRVTFISRFFRFRAKDES